jgi:hypothetical protein
MYMDWGKKQVEQKTRTTSVVYRASYPQRKEKKICRECVSSMAMGTNPIPKASANIHAKAQVEKAGRPIPEIPLVRYPEWGAPAICTTKSKPASRHRKQANRSSTHTGVFLEKKKEQEKKANGGKKLPTPSPGQLIPTTHATPS